MKRKVFSVACLVIALVLMVCLVACNDTKTFKVSAEYDSTQGSVIISDLDGNEKTTFKSGEPAVITVSANDEYSLDSFKVNGNESELNDGEYQFKVYQNTVIEVTFKKNGGGSTLPVDAFNSVKTTFKVTGSYIYQAEGENPDVNNITTIFGTNAVNLCETSTKGEINYDDVYVDIDGKLAMPYHTLDNKIKYLYPSNGELFAEYGNPFKNLTRDDFSETEDGSNVFELLGADKKKSAATAITGYNESIASFEITVEDGKVTGIDITTERIKRGSGENVYYYTATYSLSVSDWGEAEVDVNKIEPFKTTEAHTALSDALAKAFSAKNYTIGVHEEEPFAQIDKPIDYNTYVTETAIYYACEGWEEGYVEMGENVKVVYPFDYEPETGLVKLFDAVKMFPTLRSMRASFNAFNDFAPEIFKPTANADGTVTYTLYNDVNKPENVRSILLNFADGQDVIRLYAGYTYNVEITLKDGDLYQVTLDYLIGSSDYFIRTLTYSDFDNTEMPISFDNCEKVSVLDDYIGTYTDGSVTAVIDKDGIKINGQVYDITEYDVQYDMFTGVWNGGEWIIARLSAKQIALLNIDDDITYILTSTEIDPVSIPEEFGGVWSKDGTVSAIAYDKIEFNGNMLRVLSYDEEEGLYATYGEYTYLFLSRTLQENNTPVLWVTVYKDGMSTASYVLHKDENAVLLPEVLVGTFEKYDNYYGKNYKAVVGLTSVALEFGSDKPTVTVVSATNANGYWEVTLDVDGVEYSLTEGSYSTDQIDIFSIEERFSITLDRVAEESPNPPAPSVDVPENFYGTYVGDKDGVKYVVKISANGLSVKIGDAAAIVISDFEFDDGEFSFFIEDLQYGIFNYEYESGVDSVYLYNYDGLYVELTRDDNAVEIPANLYGEYYGEDSFSRVTVKIAISADGIVVELNGQPVEVVVKSAGQSDNGQGGTMFAMSLLLDGKEYIISEGYSEGVLNIYSDYDNGNTVQTTVSLVEGENPDSDVRANFCGTYKGSDNSGVEYVITIDSESVALTIDGASKTVTIDAFDDYEGFTVSIDGEIYCITNAGYSEEITSICFMSEDFRTINVILTREA